MMATTKKDVTMSEETSIILNGGDANHTETECNREAISVEIKQNNEKEFASKSTPTFNGHEYMSEDTVMIDNQNSSPEKKEEMYSINENKMEEVQNMSVLLTKKGVRTTYKVMEKDREVDNSCNIKMGVVDDTVKEVMKVDNIDVALSKNGINTAVGAVEKMIKLQILSITSSKKEVSSADEVVKQRTEVQNLRAAPSESEVTTADEIVEQRTEVQNLSAALSKDEVTTADEIVEQSTEVENLSAAPSKDEVTTADEIVEQSTEVENLSAAPSKDEVTTEDEVIEQSTEVENLSATPSKDEVTTADEVIEQSTEVENLSAAPSKNEVTTADEVIEQSTEVENLSATPSKDEVTTADEVIEQSTEVENLSAAPSKDEVTTADEVIEQSTEVENLSAAPSKDEVTTADEVIEQSTEVENLSAAPSKDEVTTADEIVEQSTEVENLSATPSKDEVTTADEIVEQRTEVENLSAAPSKGEVTTANEVIEQRTEVENLSATPSKDEVTTADEIVEQRTEVENLSAAPSKDEVTTADEIVEQRTEVENLSATPSKDEVTTADEIVEQSTEVENLSAVPSKDEVTTADEIVEQNTEVENLSAAPSKDEVTTADEIVEQSTEVENLSAAPSKDEVTTADEIVEQRTEVQNLSAALSEVEVTTADEIVEQRTEVENLSAVPSKDEVTTANEVIEQRTEVENLSAAPSKKKLSATDEAAECSGVQNLSATPSEKEASTTAEVIEKLTEAENLNAEPCSKKMSSTDAISLSATPSKKGASYTVDTMETSPEVQILSIANEAVERGTIAQTFCSVARKRKLSTADEYVDKRAKAQHVNASSSNLSRTSSSSASSSSKKEKSSIEEVVKKMKRCRNLDVAPSKEKISSKEQIQEERKEADGTSVSLCDQERSTADEGNDSSVCGPSKRVCTGVTASTSASSSSSSASDPDITVLEIIPRNSSVIRGRVSLYYRRILMNRRARLSEGFNVALNGRSIESRHPRISVPRVHVTAEAFPSLASEVYSVLPDTFKNRISMSMMEYYLMILYYHRLAGLRMNRRTPLRQDQVLLSSLEQIPLFVPDIVEQWITMRGHDVNTRGEPIRLVLPPLPNDTGDFGQLSASTHWRYISDLAPRVFRERIAADLLHTLCSGPVEWDLPEDIRPQEKNCGLPTRNLIGYHVAQKLIPTQIDELNLCGIGVWKEKAVFPMDPDAACYHLNIHLVEAVSQHLAALGSQFHIVRHSRYDCQPSSAGLVVYGERMVSETEEFLFDRNVSHYEQKAKVRAYAPVAMEKELAKGAVVFLPRVYRREGNRPINRSWCAYDFGLYFTVPDEWILTRNNAYKQGSWQTWHTPHLTTPPIMRASLLKAVVKRLVLSQRLTS